MASRGQPQTPTKKTASAAAAAGSESGSPVTPSPMTKPQNKTPKRRAAQAAVAPAAAEAAAADAEPLASSQAGGAAAEQNYATVQEVKQLCVEQRHTHTIADLLEISDGPSESHKKALLDRIDKLEELSDQLRDMHHNLVFVGAPGIGKSFMVNKLAVPDGDGQLPLSSRANANAITHVITRISRHRHQQAPKPTAGSDAMDVSTDTPARAFAVKLVIVRDDLLAKYLVEPSRTLRRHAGDCDKTLLKAEEEMMQAKPSLGDAKSAVQQLMSSINDKPATLQELGHVLQKLQETISGSPMLARTVRYIDVEGDFPGLPPDTSLVDVMGWGDIDRWHESAVTSLLNDISVLMVCTIRLASIDDLKPAVQLLSQCMQQNAHPPLVANVIKQLGENNVQERANLKAKFGALLDDSLNMALDNANTYHARSFRKQWSRSMPQDAAIFFCEHDSQQQHLERFFHEIRFKQTRRTLESYVHQLAAIVTQARYLFVNVLGNNTAGFRKCFDVVKLGHASGTRRKSAAGHPGVQLTELQTVITESSLVQARAMLADVPDDLWEQDPRAAEADLVSRIKAKMKSIKPAIVGQIRDTVKEVLAERLAVAGLNIIRKVLYFNGPIDNPDSVEPKDKRAKTKLHKFLTLAEFPSDVVDLLEFYAKWPQKAIGAATYDASPPVWLQEQVGDLWVLLQTAKEEVQKQVLTELNKNIAKPLNTMLQYIEELGTGVLDLNSDDFARLYVAPLIEKATEAVNVALDLVEAQLQKNDGEKEVPATAQSVLEEAKAFSYSLARKGKALQLSVGDAMPTDARKMQLPDVIAAQALRSNVLKKTVPNVTAPAASAQASLALLQRLLDCKEQFSAEVAIDDTLWQTDESSAAAASTQAVGRDQLRRGRFTISGVHNQETLKLTLTSTDHAWLKSYIDKSVSRRDGADNDAKSVHGRPKLWLWPIVRILQSAEEIEELCVSGFVHKDSTGRVVLDETHTIDHLVIYFCPEGTSAQLDARLRVLRSDSSANRPRDPSILIVEAPLVSQKAAEQTSPKETPSSMEVVFVEPREDEEKDDAVLITEDPALNNSNAALVLEFMRLFCMQNGIPYFWHLPHTLCRMFEYRPLTVSTKVCTVPAALTHCEAFMEELDRACLALVKQQAWGEKMPEVYEQAEIDASVKKKLFKMESLVRSMHSCAQLLAVLRNEYEMLLPHLQQLLLPLLPWLRAATLYTYTERFAVQYLISLPTSCGADVRVKPKLEYSSPFLFNVSACAARPFISQRKMYWVNPHGVVRRYVRDTLYQLGFAHVVDHGVQYTLKMTNTESESD